MNILLLIEDWHYDSLPKKITKELNIDYIFVCCKYKRKNIDSHKCIYGYNKIMDFVSIHDGFSLLILDYHPISVINIYKILNKACKIHYIQHGFYSNAIKDKIIPIKKVSWIRNTIYYIIWFFKLSYKDSSVNKLLIIIYNYAKYGSEITLAKIGESVVLENAFIWDNKSKKRFYESLPDTFRVKNLHIVGTPDRVSFKKKKNGEVYYLSQPLYKTGHCTLNEYKKSISELIKEVTGNRNKLIFIIHPKMNQEELKGFNLNIKRLSELKSTIYCERVYGHFSSLLFTVEELSLIKQIEINSKVKEHNEKFIDHYKSSMIKNDRSFFEILKKEI